MDLIRVHSRRLAVGKSSTKQPKAKTNHEWTQMDANKRIYSCSFVSIGGWKTSTKR
jgi:hypothetical protein